MPTPQKEQLVQEMTDKFSRASSIYLVDFTGMDANLANELRRNLREAHIEYRVVKNTLAKLSFHNAGIKELDPYLSGVNAYAISYDDPVLPVKILEKNKEFAEKLKFKAALFEGRLVEADKVGELSKLPSREELLAKFVALLQSPMSKLVGTLNGVGVKLVNVLKALEEKKK